MIYVFLASKLYLGGKLALELNRMLRPGGYFVWSATPVYRKNQEDSRIWEGIVCIPTVSRRSSTN